VWLLRGCGTAVVLILEISGEAQKIPRPKISTPENL
jgi:hypothetical protein